MYARPILLLHVIRQEALENKLNYGNVSVDVKFCELPYDIS